MINPLISQAKKHLKDRPFDAGHDLAHHQRVWSNAQLIASHIDDTCDLDILKVATFWHDVNLKAEHDKDPDHTANELKKMLQQRGFDLDFTQAVFLAVRDHGYSRKPQTIEAKILYDADKLDVIHIDRIQGVIEAIKQKQMSRFTLNIYIKTGRLWIKRLYKKYHFDYTRKLHVERIHQLLKDPRSQEIGQELNLNWRAILRSGLPK